MKTMLVTGGAGFIGSNFIYFEQEKRPQVRIVCLDKLTYAGNLCTLERAMERGNFRFVHADVTDAAAVDRVLEEERPDVVVNFAAESHVDRSIDNPGVFVNTNVLGTQVIMDACLRHGVRRFHQVSTDEVYGDLPLDAPAERFTEKSPLRPSSPYAASKAAADLLAMAYHRTYGLPVTISRCSNNYGRFQFPEKLIPLMALSAIEGKPMPVYGTGRNVRDWLFVDDHCRAVDLILEKGREGAVYNIGGDCELQNIEVVRRICLLLGAGEGLITYVADRKGHDLRYAMDHSLITDELGWRPEVTFDEGLRRTVRWYLDNPRWYKSIISGEYFAYRRRFCGEEPGGAER